jgi:hypothetical protein
LDPEGQIVARTSYQPGGPQGYVKQLSEFVDIHATVVKMKQELASTKGIERAKLLDKIVDAYVKLNNEGDELTGWSKEIVSLDADNKAGLKIKHEFRISMADYKKLKEKKKFAQARTALEKALALNGISASQKQSCYMEEGELCLMQNDFSGLVKFMQRAIEVDPKSKPASVARSRIELFKPVADSQEAVAKLKSQLDGTKGVDRAKLLDKLIEAQKRLVTMMPSMGAIRDIEKWSREVVYLDAENKAGLKTKYEFRAKANDAEAQIRNNSYGKARASLDEAAALPGLKVEQKNKIEQLRKRLPKEKPEPASKPKSDKK